MSQFEAQMGQVEIQTGQLDRFKSRHRNIPKNQHFDAGDAMWFFWNAPQVAFSCKGLKYELNGVLHNFLASLVALINVY